MPRRKYRSLYERLVANTYVDEDGCWIWMGHVNNRGYPKLSIRVPGKPNPVQVYAHRKMLELTTGFEFPFDEAGHYDCHKPLCIHPRCLEIQAPAHNLSDRRGYMPVNGKARWLPILFPIEGHEPIPLPERTPGRPATTEQCPF